LRVEPETFAVSAVKACEDEDGWLVRAANLEDQVRLVRLQLWRPTVYAASANLLEQPIQSLTLENGVELKFSVGAHQITTIRFN
jgi:alpha-mannosidase